MAESPDSINVEYINEGIQPCLLGAAPEAFRSMPTPHPYRGCECRKKKLRYLFGYQPSPRLQIAIS
ncbi:MAG: hypothetical protein GY768_26390 [Planctomycetaceae bacterium]|nr:hypothetical protein [Planctomycetaceae bacterium]